MKIIDAMVKRESLKAEMSHVERYYGRAVCQNEARKLESKVREANEENKKKLDQIDGLSNQINEALATNYSKVQGVEMSLATMLDYIKKYKKPSATRFCNPLPPMGLGFGDSRPFGGFNGLCSPVMDDEPDEEVRYRYVSSSRSLDVMPDPYVEEDEVMVNPDEVALDYHGINKIKLYLDIQGEFLKQVSSIDL